MRAGTWLLARIETGVAVAIDKTPWWVFVHGPRFLGTLLVGCVFFYGLHAATGVSLNPFENFGELVGHLERNRAAASQ